MSPGFVYLFSADNGMYKIGQSTCPEHRVKDFSTLPYNVRLVHKFSTDDMDYWESWAHKCLAAYRVKGEWFRLPQDSIDDFLSITVTKNGDIIESSQSLFDQMMAEYSPT